VVADITITGVDNLQRLARDLKEIGDKELRKELYKGINRSTKPMKAKVKNAALADMPKAGGLNKFVASARLSTTTRGGGRNPGVTIKGRKSGHDLRAIDRGKLRHPVFGDREVWVNQKVKPGFFTKTLAAEAPTVRKELIGVIDDIRKQMGRRRV